jgi:hypothetical protein
MGGNAVDMLGLKISKFRTAFKTSHAIALHPLNFPRRDVTERPQALVESVLLSTAYADRVCCPIRYLETWHLPWSLLDILEGAGSDHEKGNHDAHFNFGVHA